VIYKGRSFKVYRGMGSLGAMVSARPTAIGRTGPDRQKLVRKASRDGCRTEPTLAVRLPLVGGLRAGMATAARRRSIAHPHSFIKVSAASVWESHPHDIAITQEPPNYSMRAEASALQTAASLSAAAVLLLTGGAASAQRWLPSPRLAAGGAGGRGGGAAGGRDAGAGRARRSRQAASSR
jgi:hypothetical protein